MEKVKVKMVKTALGADEDKDGKNHGVKTYEEGQEYEIGPALAKCFVDDMKVAEKVSDKKPSKKDSEK
jgi:hypothetical protein